MVMTQSTLKKRQQKNGGYEGGIRVLRKAFKPLPSKVLALLVITLFHYFQLDDVCSYRIGADEVVIWLVMKWAFSLFSGGIHILVRSKDGHISNLVAAREIFLTIASLKNTVFISFVVLFLFSYYFYSRISRT